MHRRIPVLIVGLALVLVVRSDEPLKCYMCTSLTNPGCDTDPKAHNIEPVECTLTHMADWQGTVNQNNDLKAISHIFEVDNFQHSQSPGPMACAKMVLKVNKAEVIVRNCQTAKTETIDPCKAIQGKFSNEIMQHCDLCMHDACNGSIAPTARILLVLLSLVGSVILGAIYNGA
ncbi:UPAR/Ly6 domain-containing protein CG9338 [Ptiloglossa arizonensis]|uniref:UPAR/Ly6 domain-containing protein CG9338 n=1 Tax=Ptiloglossa arizonensis TaxID=3350558 RepID=UPI003F9F809C